MAEYLIQGESLTAIADEVRELSGTITSLGLDDMTSNLSEANTEVSSQTDLIAQIQEALQGKAVGGDNTEIEDAMISGNISGAYMNDRITILRFGAFASCSKLTVVNFPECTSIGSSAFGSCYSLTTVSSPKCTQIGSYAFANCSNLTTASFPKCTSIGSGAFRMCSNLTTVSFPACTSIGSYTFANDKSLTTASFPVCTTMGGCAFQNCYRITTVSFPAAISIGSSAFQSCWTLSSLTLGASTVCKLSNSNAFSSTPYVGYSNNFSGTPYIYVPSSLIASYQSATNWTYFSSYFSAIENMSE